MTEPKPKETPEELLARTGIRFATHVLIHSQRAANVTAALAAARESIERAEPSEDITRSALNATMPVAWLDERTEAELAALSHEQAKAMLAFFASFWCLGFDKGVAAQ